MSAANVPAVHGALEGDVLHGGVSPVESRFLQGVAQGGDAQHPAAVCQEPAVLQPGAGVVDGDALSLAVCIQAVDLQCPWDSCRDSRRWP